MTKVLNWVLFFTGLAALLPYANIHRLLILEPLPITAREAAPVTQTAALLDPGSSPMYSTESLLEASNLYGPLYPLAAAPAAALLPSRPYAAHRLTTGLFLVLGCVLIGAAIAKRAGFIPGFIAAVVFYTANVATPSLAAGPDTLATLFYIGSILTIYAWGIRPATIALSILLGGLAFLTKPYTSLTIPSLCIYLFLFRSRRLALITAGLSAAATGVAALVIQHIWPAYFFPCSRCISFRPLDIGVSSEINGSNLATSTSRPSSYSLGWSRGERSSRAAGN